MGLVLPRGIADILVRPDVQENIIHRFHYCPVVLERTKRERSADGSQSFFRKGVIGDWKQHLTGAIAADIERIEREQAGSPTVLDRLQLRMRYAYCSLRKI